MSEHSRDSIVPSLHDGFRDTWRILKLMRPFWRRIGRGVWLSASISVLGLLAPVLSKLFFDEVLPARDAAFLRVLVIALFVISVTTAFMNALSSYYAQVLSVAISSEFRLLFFDHLQRLPSAFHESRQVGEIVSRSGDMQRSLAFVTGLFQTVFLSGAYLLVIPPVLIALNWQLALLSLASLPLTTIVSIGVGKAIRRRSKAATELNAAASAYSVEVLGNIRLVKSLAVEVDTAAEMRNRVLQAQDLQLEGSALSAQLGVLNTLIRALGTAAFSWLAWSMIIDQQLSMGSFVAFSAYVGLLTGPVGQFAGLFMSLQDTSVSLRRFFEYFDQPAEGAGIESGGRGSRSSQRLQGRVALCGVSFGYSNGNRVLSEADWEVGPGGVHALVGRSGAGKSSVVKLLQRMHDPQRGEVRLDGVAAAQYDLYTLRRQIAVVWQETGVFRGTIRENLTCGLRDVSTSRVDDALRRAQLAEYIYGLPDGVDTTIGEWGVTLSGGQKQRLAIARALLRQAPVLVLDEATSHLDLPTETAILESVFKLRHQVTIVVITHRLASIRKADRIFVVENGSITGGATHEQLVLAHQGYRHLLGVETGEVSDRDFVAQDDSLRGDLHVVSA